MKTCSRCEQTKALDYFGKNKTKKDGHNSECKECVRAYNAEYYKANSDRIKSKVKDYREKNSDVVKQRKSRYAKENALAIRKKVAEWQRANPEKRAQNAKAHRQRHPERENAKAAKRRARARKNGVFTFTQKELKKIYSSPCFYCGSKKNIELDHILPISKGGRHSIGNAVSACRLCNSQKSNKLLIQWKKERNIDGYHSH